jgi:hypothetical protein
MALEELQVNLLKLKARELELIKESEANHDSLMIALGEVRGYTMCLQEVETKIRAELETKIRAELETKIRAKLEANKPKK